MRWHGRGKVARGCFNLWALRVLEDIILVLIDTIEHFFLCLIFDGLELWMLYNHLIDHEEARFLSMIAKLFAL